MQKNTNREHHNAKLTEAEVRKIRELYQTKQYTFKALGEMYNINKTAIGKIVNRETWAHVK